MKTGTPPRLKKSSIDFSKFARQDAEGDKKGSPLEPQRPEDGESSGFESAQYHPGVATRKAMLSKRGRLALETSDGCLAGLAIVQEAVLWN